MYSKIIKPMKWASILFLVVAATLLSVRVYDSQRGPPLAPWHTHVPQELSAAELDASDWNGYLAHALLRASSNPFFPYMVDRIGEGIEQRDTPAKTVTTPPTSAPDVMPDEDDGDWSIGDTISVISKFLRGQHDDTEESP